MGVFHKARFILTALLIHLTLNSAFAGDEKSRSLNKSSGSSAYAIFNINNISTYIYNNGETDINLQGNSGFEIPKGSGKAAFFQSGLLWGGKVNNEIRAGGSFYNSMLTPGRMLPGNTPDPVYADRTYRVRPDYKKADFSSEIAGLEGTAEEIMLRYANDWKEWPAADGAPFEDKNNNGRYDPGTDIPGVPGASQTIWFVASERDDTLTYKYLRSKSLGIETQVTVWGYKNMGVLDNMLFKSYRIINKSTNTIDSMYAMIFSDPDLGDAGDDFIACDTLLNLGYVYNAKLPDRVYGTNPPAAGFTYLQGPFIPGKQSDTAMFLGRKITGKKNLLMTAFKYGFKSTPVEPEVSMGTTYEKGALRLYKFMQGLDVFGNPWLLPLSMGGGPTKYIYSGDPVTGTGYLGGMVSANGHSATYHDHRMALTSGPFTMAPGDTQEVVFAQLAAGGPQTMLNNFQAITLLRQYSRTASQAYLLNFKIPTAPPNPMVEKSETDREIILDWGTNTERVDATEKYHASDYHFEGYNVYQLPRADSKLSEAKRIVTFDRIDGIKSILDIEIDSVSFDGVSRVSQYGTDSGIKRYLKIDHDYIKNTPLVNGSRYYYAVTSYSASQAGSFGRNSYESIPEIITAVPHSADPGIRYGGAFGDSLKVFRISGNSDGTAAALVIDPAKLTGHTYRVGFENLNGIYSWKLTDNTTNEIKLTGQTNQSGSDSSITVDGVLVKVYGPKPGIKSEDSYSTHEEFKWGWDVPSGIRRWSWTNANVSQFNLEAFSSAAGNGKCLAGGYWWNSSVKPEKLKNVLLRFAQTDTAGNILNPSDQNVSYAYRYLRKCNYPPAKPEFANFIINTSASYDYQDFNRNFPFAAFDMESNPPRRLAVGYLENNVVKGTVNGKYWPPNSSFADPTIGNSSTEGPREWFFIFDVPYKETPDPVLMKNNFDENNPLPLMYLGMPNMKGTTAFAAGDQFAIYPNHINNEQDAWIFTAPAVIKDINAAKEDVEKINVFPNPYYGANSQELNKYQKFVTFSHLPERATIRIFNLAGELVRTIRKNSPGQFQQWDLLTESQYYAGSGLYIVHIEMPDLGKAKILKLCVIQEYTIPDHF